MEKALIVEKRQKIAWLKLNRPKCFNAINDELVHEFHLAFDDIENDPEIRVVVITGEGKAFCAGGDLTYLESLTNVARRTAFIEKVGMMAKRITLLPKPVIAMVNGVAAGAGANLMLACDLAYANENAVFAQSFLKVGLIPDCGGLYLLPKAVGIRKAKELMFTSELITAAEALTLGMLNHVTTAETLLLETQKMAERLTAAAPLALSFTKNILNKSNLNLDDILTYENSTQALCMSTQDAQEGINAFKEKRSPLFSGK
ncbi:MAG TPA: enoyl-CoA hydratase/isomerase family protein [Candidatus Avacidaminococcus intestinavium]|uniref:Enoyl-CoA hydratase/isomerase family protein n=1 Tax=Candidatus Avacidaminococcus intestinavium TaxID=2840684 RepID=A0A9D1MQP9_9FIRM|nr:enoyl-CoA hydratase/isomerase family protein [Candidatus Avacidaminococcus intestinavium]